MKEMTFGKRIGAGFGIMLVLIVALSTLSFMGVVSIVSDAEMVIHGNELERALSQKEVDHLSWANDVNALLTDETVTTLEIETDHHKCGFGEWLYGEKRTAAEELVPSLVPLFKEIEGPHRKLHESAVSIQKVFRPAERSLPAFLAEKEVDHLKWASKIRDALLVKETGLEIQTDAEKCALGEWLQSEDAIRAYQQGSAEFKNYWDEMIEKHEKLHESATEVQKGMNISNAAAVEVFRKKTHPLLDGTLNLVEKLRAEAKANLEGQKKAAALYAEVTIRTLESTRELLKAIQEQAQQHIMTDKVMLNEATATKKQVTIIGLSACVVGLALAFFISRGLTIVLKDTSSQLDDTSDQVASASSQVSAGSQALAEGASEQATSIEETSSSLEEMSAMIRRNAENADQANMLMGQSGKVMLQAEQSMQGLADSMDEISQASEETSKIIKTIDEIAFQTNLLALNAAVEAARAGEAGTGFAVVADEVRNLALRAAEAAKTTAGLIEGTIMKVKDGVALGYSTKNDFENVAESLRKVTGLVNEITSATDEQAHGIEQIGEAVSEMEKVVQQNAANAEESASAAEEMNAQSEQMKYLVANLTALAGVSNNGNRPAVKTPANTSDRAREKAFVSGRMEMSPAQMIPFEEKEFEDF